MFLALFRCGGSDLPTLVNKRDVRIRAIAVHEVAEAPKRHRVFDRLLPFAFIAVHDARHLGLELRSDAERVLADHLLEILQPPFKVVPPRGGALQAIRRADVEHEKPVDVADERVFVEIPGKELRVAWPHAAVSAYVEIPALLGGDHANVFALRLRALTRASGDCQLYFVRSPQSLVAILDFDGETDAVLNAVAAPAGADAGLHGAHGFAVGMSGFKAGPDQLRPDER